jgi:hypothetical protein
MQSFSFFVGVYSFVYLFIFHFSQQQAPGGRSNAKMISKSTFKEFSLAHPDGNYFLRPDRILGAFHVDSSAPPVLVSIETVSELMVEKHRELRVNESLQLADSKQRSNTIRIDRSIGSIWAVDEVKAMMEKSVKEFSIIKEEENVATVKFQKENKDKMAATFGPMEGGDIEMNDVTRTYKTVFEREDEDRRERSNQSVSTSPLIHEENSFGVEYDCTSADGDIFIFRSLVEVWKLGLRFED